MLQRRTGARPPSVQGSYGRDEAARRHSARRGSVVTRSVHPGAGSDRWAMILAGGDGMRLRSLTRRITGDERPKQFCPVIGGRTLLEQTWRRTGQVVPPERTLLVFTRRHERFYQPLVSELKARHVVAQPENRGTAAGILGAPFRTSQRPSLRSCRRWARRPRRTRWDVSISGCPRATFRMRYSRCAPAGSRCCPFTVWRGATSEARNASARPSDAWSKAWP